MNESPNLDQDEQDPRDILPNPYRISLDAEKWEQFLAMLDAHPRELPGVRRLFSEPSIFEIHNVE